MKNRKQLNEKVETGKIAGSKRLGLVGLALLGTLSFGNITEGIAQESTPQERENDRKEIVIKTPAQVQNDSTISLDEVLNILKESEDLKSYYKTVIVENLENGEKFDLLIDHIMGLEIVQNLLKVYDEDYIRETLKREINQSLKTLKREVNQALKKLKGEYSDEFINKSIEEIINNTDSFKKYLDKVIRRCVSDTNFQNAIKNGDNDEVKKIIEEKIKNIEDNRNDIFEYIAIIIVGFILWRITV